MSDPLQQLQRDVCGILRSTPALADVRIEPVMIDETSPTAAALTAQINNALAGALERNSKYGATIFVEPPTTEAHGMTAGAGRRVSIALTLIEHPLVNRGASGTGVTIGQLDLEVGKALQHRLLPGLGAQTLTFARSEPIGAANEADPSLKREVVFTVGLEPSEESRVASPVIAYAAGSVTLTCATSGAAIYYTTDGTFPTPATSPYAANGTLYSAPFAASAGTTVRAVAYKSALSPSNVKAQTLT